MNILALDTSTEACSVALRVADHVLERYHEAPRGHAELILPLIDELLAEADITLKDLQAIAFGRGPGSFTGLRLAASVVQGLAFGAGVGVVPVSTLRAVARRAALSARTPATHVLVCNDARMEEVYTAAFALVGADPIALGAEQVLAPAAVRLPSHDLAASLGSPATGGSPASGTPRWIGAACQAICSYPSRALRANAPREVFPAEVFLEEVFDELLPRAADILELAIPDVAAGRVLPPAAALPIYVRGEVAKVPRPVITLQQ